jgi:hypothetical protein
VLVNGLRVARVTEGGCGHNEGIANVRDANEMFVLRHRNEFKQYLGRIGNGLNTSSLKLGRREEQSSRPLP